MEVLLDKKRLVEEIQKNNLNEILDMLDCISDEEFDILIEDDDCLSDVICKNIKNRGCSEFIRILDKQRYQKKHFVNLNQEYFLNRKEELQNCNDNEKEHSFRDLLCKNIFNSDSKLCIISKGEGYRFIDNEKEWKELLILFANTTMREEDFAKKIILLYDSLVFDEEISKSMKKLTAGLNTRRPEILYHLYCIEKIFPQIYEKSAMGNVQAGKEFKEKCGIQCSPERKQEKRQLLTKTIDEFNIVCEMHTKMERYGTQKPDRIYFNPCVREKVTIDGRCIKGKIYIYKITGHI